MESVNCFLFFCPYSLILIHRSPCIHPDGAFYLFVKSPVPDANEFSAKAKEFDLLLVPADSFGTPGFVRIAYCVATDMIRRSLPAFEKLAACYREELKK